MPNYYSGGVTDFSAGLRRTAPAAPGPSGIMGLLRRPGVNEGLLAFGLNMLASDKSRETTGQAVLRSFGAGAAAYDHGQRESAYNDLLEGADERTRALLQMLGPERGTMLLAQQAFAPEPEPVAVPEGTDLVDPTTREVVYSNEREEAPDRRVIDGNLVEIGADGAVTTLYESPDEVEFGDVAALRNRFEANVAPYEQSAQAFRKMEASATGEATPAKDIALVFNYMKAIDPASSVREGEFATAQNAGSAWTIAGNLYNRLLTGQRLNETQREEFLAAAREQVASLLPQYQEVADQYRSIAESNRFDPTQVIRNPFKGLNLAPPTRPDPLGLR